MQKLVFGILGAMFIGYLLACAALYAYQRQLIYFPQPGSDTPGATTLTLEAGAERVRVTVREHAGAAALIYFGGNAEDVSHSLPDLAAAFPQHALYLMHYRGYGGSSGQPSEQALMDDAMALFDRVKLQHPQVVLAGRSLGSGIAVHLASLRRPQRLILITPYDSIMEIAAQQFPYFPVRWLLQDRYESWRYAPKVSSPALLLAAEHDEVIPRASTEALFRAFRPGVAAMRVLPGAGHNDVSDSADYVEALKSGR